MLSFGFAFPLPFGFLSALPSLLPSFVLRLCLYCLAFLCMRLFPRSVRSMQSAETSEPAEMEERRQGERPAGLVLLCLVAVVIGAYCYNMRGLCLQGDRPPPARGTFSVRMDGGKAPNRSCSSPSSLVPRQKTNSWQRDNYRMGIFMTKTLQEHNPQLSCFVLLGYKQLVANRF